VRISGWWLVFSTPSTLATCRTSRQNRGPSEDLGIVQYDGSESHFTIHASDTPSFQRYSSSFPESRRFHVLCSSSSLHSRVSYLLCFNSSVLCSATADLRTPPLPVAPRIHGPKVYGVRPGHSFLYRLPCTGIRPIAFSVVNLRASLHLDANTGIIRSTAPIVRASTSSN